MARLLAHQWSLPFLEGEAARVDLGAAAALSVEHARRLMVCPIALEQERLVVALADPSEERLAAVRGLTDREISFAVTTTSALEQFLAATTASEDPVGEDPAWADASEEKLDLLLGESDASAARLRSLRSEVARLAETLRDDRQELTRQREQLASLEVEREQGRLTIERLERELAQRDELLAMLRTKLTDLTSALEPE